MTARILANADNSLCVAACGLAENILYLIRLAISPARDNPVSHVGENAHWGQKASSPINAR